MGFLLKFILIAIIVFYLLKYVGRLVLPGVVRHLLKKMNQPDFPGFDHQHQADTGREGEVHIHKNTVKKQKNTDMKKNGEYVDYEEID